VSTLVSPMVGRFPRRRSHDQRAGTAAWNLVRAGAGTHRLVLGHQAVAPDFHEITALHARLEALAGHGCLVTVDAIGCQTAIAPAIIAQGADDVLAAVGQPAPLADGG
jgi:hypothetical protein